MKIIKSELTAKILITAMIVILVGGLIVWMTGVFNDKKADINSGTGKIESETNQISEFDILAWDGETIGGKALKKLMYELYDTIRKNSLLLEVHVKPLKGSKIVIILPCMRPVHTTISYDFVEEELDEIVPTGFYKGEVEYNYTNILFLTFTQQK